MMNKEEIKAVMNFIDFCIDRDKGSKQMLEVMFMYYMQSKQSV